MTCWRQSSASPMSRMASSSSRIWCLKRTLTDSGDHLQIFFSPLPLISIHMGLVNAICVCSTGRSLSASVDRKWRFPVWWWWETWPSSIQSSSPTRKPSPNCRTSRKIRNCSATALYHRYRDGPVTKQITIVLPNTYIWLIDWLILSILLYWALNFSFAIDPNLIPCCPC